MATDKTPAATGTGAAKQAQAKVPPKKAAPKTKAKTKVTAKAAPVVLDPPKKSTPRKSREKPASQPDVIDVKAVDVTKPAKAKPQKPTTTTTTATTKQEAPKQDPHKGPSRYYLGVAALFAGGAAVALGYFVAFKTLQRPDTSGEINALNDRYSAELQDIKGRLSTLEATSDKANTSSLGDVSALQASFKDQSRVLSERLAKAEAQIAELTKMASRGSTASSSLASSSLNGVSADLDSIKQQISALDQAKNDMVSRVGKIEQQGQTELAAAKTKARDLEKTVALAKTGIDMRLAKERLSAAIDAGKPFADLLTQLATGTDVPFPEVLVSAANTGVSSLADLQNSFADVARLALKASIIADAGPGVGSRLTAFLKAQLGARSLEPKEGDDPDAILSRAEAALKTGNLAKTIDLGTQLPESGVAAMKNWLDRATKRLEVKNAFAEFSTTLGEK